MPLEIAATIDQLNNAWPLHTDPENQGDGHLRLIKATIQTTFPNITGAVTGTQAQLNALATAEAGLVAMASSNVTQLASAGAAVPSGVICMWFGSAASIPAGWVMCNGSNGTPSMNGAVPIGINTGTPVVSPTEYTLGSGTNPGAFIYFIMKT